MLRFQSSLKNQRKCQHVSIYALGDLIDQLVDVDRYVIDYSELSMDKEIGRGNFGVVYKGTWRGGLVAIKQLIIKEGITEKEWEEEKMRENHTYLPLIA